MELRRPDPPVQDDTIRLEPLSRRHLDAMETLGSDPAVITHTYVSDAFDGDEAVMWLARYIRGWGDGSCAGFAIEEAATGHFLGFCSLVRVDAAAREAEIGYITAPEARGRAVAGRALKLITRWAIDVLEMKRLELRISSDNRASMIVAERAGYEHEGILRSVHFKEGIRKDTVVYACVAG